MYRQPADPQLDITPQWPRWPALAGIRFAARCVVAWLTVPTVWAALRAIVAHVFTPLALIIHGLRELGEADPEREDSCKNLVAAWEFNGNTASCLVQMVVCALWIVAAIGVISLTCGA